MFFFSFFFSTWREKRMEKVALTIYPINTIERAALSICVIHAIDYVYTGEPPTIYTTMWKGASCSADGRESVCNSGDRGSIPGSGRSPEKGNGSPLMAAHSSTLSWRLPWTEEPGRLQSMGSWRIRYNWSDLACMHAWLIHIIVQQKLTQYCKTIMLQLKKKWKKKLCHILVVIK